MISEAFQEVMIPALDDMETRLNAELASKEEVHEVNMKVDSLNRKFDAQQERLDKHNERVETLEKIHLHGKHMLAAA